MIITTSQYIEGYAISEYLGVVPADQVMVLAAGNKGVQRGWQAGVEGASDALQQQAAAMGADAIVAARFERFGPNTCATGTAVRLREAG